MLRESARVNPFVQFLYDRVTPGSARSRVRHRARSSQFLARRIRSLIRNRQIECPIKGFPLLMPASHLLPQFVAQHPYYCTNVGRLAAHVLDKYSHLTFIDVGANIGDTIPFLRSEAEFPILCVEGEEEFLPILKQNARQFTNVSIVAGFLGGRSEANTGYFADRTDGTSARLTRIAHAGDACGTVAIRALDDVLSCEPAFAQSKMLKIDTDGFDFQVLSGAMRFLESVRPVVFLEYVPSLLAAHGDDGTSFFGELAGVGYCDVLVYENTGQFILSANLSNHRLLSELREYLMHFGTRRYFDLCVFHKDDHDLFETSRAAEIAFFKEARDSMSHLT